MGGGEDCSTAIVAKCSPSPHEILTSEFHAKLSAIRNFLAFSLRARHAPGTYAAPDQRTAEPSREPGCSGAWARSRRSRTDL